MSEHFLSTSQALKQTHILMEKLRFPEFNQMKMAIKAYSKGMKLKFDYFLQRLL